MRILMLGWELPPHYVGGMGIVCDQLTRHMANSGAEIEFILPFEADYSHISHMKVTPAIHQHAKLQMDGGSTYDSFRYEVTTKNGTKNVRTLHEQVELFAQNVSSMTNLGEYDVIHAHDWLTFRAGLALKQKSGMPLFVHVHATEFDRAGGKHGNPLVHDIEYVGFHMADHIFVLCERQKNIIVENYHISPDKISIAENYMEIPAHLRIEEHETYPYLVKMRELGYGVVLNAGRMTVQKGIFHLITAAQKVVATRPKTLFLFVGGGEQIPELLEYAASLGLAGNMIFTGRVEGVGKQWRDSFRAADLFVMPSVSEPMGLVPYESIAYGAPTLVSKQSGIVEYLTNTLKVDYWDTDEMANQICAVLENNDLRQTLLQNAQNEYDKRSWKGTASHILDSYNRVLTQQREASYV